MAVRRKVGGRPGWDALLTTKPTPSIKSTPYLPEKLGSKTPEYTT